ncbi:L-lactate permease [Leptotrichia sp. oral taxon 847]|uniref:L-lactate permease n=1 Tax=Leptotrichia sp. oral taxon 847 TaxID=1785996 RepID=UPI000768390A|nr:L-lactate permease [Leptotrichia sp. oral taxon 847]AMD95003.1 lactate permease [Leptotrichia sp. oral taxon 847]
MEFLVGLVPVVVFLILLTFLKKSAMFSAYASLVVAIILNFVMPGWRMPIQGVFASIIEGFATAWMPIGFVVFAALFAYDLSVKTGKIETIKSMLGSISTDKRAQALILAWGFGGFIEGIAGYGTAVAIPAAIMVSLGFTPLNAALICLIANSTPTAFGTVGLPVTTMITNFNLNPGETAFYTSLLLLVLTCIIPFILVIMANKEIDGGKNAAFGRGILPVVIASIIGYLTQPFIAKTMGAELPTILSSLFAMILMIVATKIFIKEDKNAQANNKGQAVTGKDAFMAWIPYILMIILIIGTSPVVEAVHKALEPTTTQFNFAFGHEAAWFKDGGDPRVTFKWILAPAAPLFVATVIAGFIQGVKPKVMAETLKETILSKLPSVIVIMGIVALSVVMKHSGMIGSIAKGFAATGKFFPFISPFLGTIGTFVTGSDLASNLLFGGVQVKLGGNDALKALYIAAGTGGATGGKMISPQNIAIAASTVGLMGKEGDMLKFTVKYSIAYAAVLGILTFIGAGMLH